MFSFFKKRIFWLTLLLIVGVAGGFMLQGRGYKQMVFDWLYQKKLEQQASELSEKNLKLTVAQKISRASYPRVANLFLKTPITKKEAQELSKWDVVILGMQAQTESPEAIRLIKQLNPDIILLAYTCPVAVPKYRLQVLEPSGQGLWHSLVGSLSEKNYLKTSKGADIFIWQDKGSPLINLVSEVNYQGKKVSLAEYSSLFYKTQVLDSGLWDGIFFDTTWPTISWINPEIDYDRDGQPDPQEAVNRKWNQGLREFFKKLRDLSGPEYLLVGNDQGKFFDFLNGRMFEDFPSIWNGGWVGSMTEAAQHLVTSYPPGFFIINCSTYNTGRQDLEKMRFCLASTLLLDGFFNYDWGSDHRSTLWWYPEYEKDLGRPLGPALRLVQGAWQKASFWKEGVYRREFEKGQVLVNSSDKPAEVFLEHGEKITLSAKQGLIMTKER